MKTSLFTGFSKEEPFAVGLNSAFQAFTFFSCPSLRPAPQVRDQDIPVKRNLVRVIVNVDDANDNAPWFVGTPFSGRVFESAAVGSAVLQVTARDKDRGANAEITYSLESGKRPETFVAATEVSQQKASFVKYYMR